MAVSRAAVELDLHIVGPHGGGATEGRNAFRSQSQCGEVSGDDGAVAAAMGTTSCHSSLEGLFRQCEVVWEELLASCDCPEALLVDWRSVLMPIGKVPEKAT